MAKIKALVLLEVVVLLCWSVMSNAYGPGQLLVQAQPSATTTTIYTAPAQGTGAQQSNVVITTVWVANIDSSLHSFRMAIAPACAADATSQYIYYGVALSANSSFVQAVSLPLSGGDCVRVQSSAAQLLNFHLYGSTAP